MSTFIILFLNTNLIALQIEAIYTFKHDARDFFFVANRFKNYGSTIIGTIFSTNVFLYCGVAFDIFLNYFIRKRKRSEHIFPIESRYAYILNTVFAVFFYCF